MIDRSDPQFKSDFEHFQTSRIARIFPLLRTGVWHATSPSGAKAIVSSGAIRPNTGQFPFTFPQTANSYALQKGVVSLFDFETASEEECIFFHMKWAGFFYHHEPYTVAIQLERQHLKQGLIPNKRAREEVGYTKVWIPWVEAWHDGPISTAFISRYLVIPAQLNLATEELLPDDRRVRDIGRGDLAWLSKTLHRN